MIYKEENYPQREYISTLDCVIKLAQYTVSNKSAERVRISTLDCVIKLAQYSVSNKLDWYTNVRVVESPLEQIRRVSPAWEDLLFADSNIHV